MLGKYLVGVTDVVSGVLEDVLAISHSHKVYALYTFISTLQDDDDDLTLSRHVKREQGQCDLSLVALFFQPPLHGVLPSISA